MRQVQCRHCLAFVQAPTASAKIPARCPRCLERLRVSGETTSAIVSAADRARNRVCSICRRTLTLRQIAGNCCDDPQCRRVYLGRRRKEQREKEEQRLRQRAVLAGAAAMQFQQWSQDEASEGSAVVSLLEPDSIALLPSNNLPLVRIPEERRQKMHEHLRQVGAEARELVDERGEFDSEGAESASSTPTADELSKSAILAGGCATCRGYCCQGGGEHAYLKAEKIGGYLKSRERDDEVLDAYMSCLPEISFDGSCLFHGETGCGLPYEMRSDTCCSFHCLEFSRLRELLTHEQPNSVLAVATNSGSIVRMALLDGQTVRPIECRLVRLDLAVGKEKVPDTFSVRPCVEGWKTVRLILCKRRQLSADVLERDMGLARNGRTRMKRLVLALACIAGLLVGVMFVRAVRDAREAANSAHCASNLTLLNLAISNYHYTYDCFPPAYIADEHGTPMHSWRVLILPFLDEKETYDRYDFSQPWNAPSNLEVGQSRAARHFRCPSNRAGQPGAASYFAVVGSATAWPGQESSAVSDITNNLSQTILLVEVQESGVHWLEPKDIELEQMTAGDLGDQLLAADSSVTHSPHYLTVERTVGHLPQPLTMEVLVSRCSRDEAFLLPRGAHSQP